MPIPTIDYAMTQGTVGMSRWGRDHWSVFHYITTRCVGASDGIGVPDHRSVQTNHNRHPGMANPLDGSDYPIRLANGENMPPADYDDCEREGLLEHVGTGIHPAYTLTEKGFDALEQLVRYKEAGGNYARFKYNG